MKQLFLLLTSLLIFIGCSRDTAFDRFPITQKQKLAENSIQSSKIKNKNNIDGVVNVLYLNEVNHKIYNDKEYFYIYFYIKNKSIKPLFLLNNKYPLHITKLDNENQFSNLISFNAPWSQYYLIEFAKQGDNLNFQLKNGKYTSDILKFEKDK